jgi:hypothetical protein
MNFKTLLDTNCPANIAYLFESNEINDLFEIIELDKNDVVNSTLTALQIDNLESIIVENYENGATIKVKITKDTNITLCIQDITINKIMEVFKYNTDDTDNEYFGYALYKMCNYYLLIAGLPIDQSDSSIVDAIDDEFYSSSS